MPGLNKSAVLPDRGRIQEAEKRNRILRKEELELQQRRQQYKQQTGKQRMDEKTSTSPSTGIGVTPITAITPILCSSPPVSCSGLTFHDGFYDLYQWSGNQRHWHPPKDSAADATDFLMHAAAENEQCVCESVAAAAAEKMHHSHRPHSPWTQGHPDMHQESGMAVTPIPSSSSPVSCSAQRHKWKKCASRRTLVSSAVCLFCSLVLVLACLTGALLFRTPEFPNDKLRSEQISQLRNKTVLKLWTITDQFNVLYKENWTALVTNEIAIFQQQLVESLRREPHVGFDVHALPFVSLFFCDCSKSQSHQRSERKGGSETREDCH